MKQRGSERMWLRQSVGQEKKKQREREHGRKREGDDRRGRWESQQEGGRTGGRALRTVSFDKPAT